MASEYRIHPPTVLATLPRPLDQTNGRIVAREVYSQRDGSKRRKRAEIVSAVDGESVSIFDVPSARSITSYPIPPQECFTCPPYSVRLRSSNNKDVFRYTFTATRHDTCQKIALFKDVIRPDGKMTSTSTSQALQASSVKHITGMSSKKSSQTIGEIHLVCDDGEFISLCGESLAIQWTSSWAAVVGDTMPAAVQNVTLESVSSGSLLEFRQGVLRERPEVVSVLPQGADWEPHMFILILRSRLRKSITHHVVLLAAASPAPSVDATHRLVVLEIAPLPRTSEDLDDNPSYSVDIQSGHLLVLGGGSIAKFDISRAIPKEISSFETGGTESILCLSRPFLLASSPSSLVLYNHLYQSVHAELVSNISERLGSIRNESKLQLLTFLRTQNLVVALVDNALVSILIEPPQGYGSKRKAQGRLIDSIGRGPPAKYRKRRRRSPKALSDFSHHLPGSITAGYIAKHEEEMHLADDLLSKNEVADWEDLLRRKFGMTHDDPANSSANRAAGDGESHSSDPRLIPDWNWRIGSPYQTVDRRWVIYAISQVFTFEPALTSEAKPRLRLLLPDSNVTIYLVNAGHLTQTNLDQAFRGELGAEQAGRKVLAESLMQCLCDADPSLALLCYFIKFTKLEEAELLLAIRRLMLSMDLMPDSSQLHRLKLLTEKPQEGKDVDEMELDKLEQEIAATELYLGDFSSSRSQGLTLALVKLWQLPALSTVRALRHCMQANEILAVIYLLRMELVRGAWTSAYLEASSTNFAVGESPPDGIIVLIADLLGRCLDAIGANGWFFSDSTCWAERADVSDFLTALKLEVTAALEGIQQNVYLNGILGEVVRYGAAASTGRASRPANTIVQSWTKQRHGRESRLLPLGLKAVTLPTNEKVVYGGEVVQRSRREKGHLISQNVAPYSLEKIEI